MQREKINYLDESVFSYIDYFFAKTLLKKEEGEEFLALAYLFFISRCGHLCLKVNFSDEKIFPNMGVCEEKDIIKGLLNIPKNLISENLKDYEKKPICFLKNCFYLQRNFIFETQIIENLERLLFDNKDTFLEKEKFYFQKNLKEEQEEAIKYIIKNKISVILGEPGSGKTYIAVTFISEILRKFKDYKIIVTAPTGKAVSDFCNKINDSTVESYTLHHLLNKNFIDADLIIIDEASMIDARIFANFLKKINLKTKLIFLGDDKQLPPVESKGLLNILSSLNISYFLRSSERFKNENIKKMKEEVENKNVNKFFNFLKKDNFFPFEEEILEKKIFEYADKISNSLKEDPSNFSKFIILSAMRKGYFGSEYINLKILESLKDKELYIPIIVTKNDYHLNIFNGTCGVIKKKEETVYFQNGREIPVIMLTNFSYAYSISVHKSQGSEFDNVLLILQDNSHIFGKNLLYTAITRTKKNIEIISNEETIKKMIKQDSLLENNIFKRSSFLQKL